MENSVFSRQVFDVSWEPSQLPSRSRLFPHSPTCVFCYWTVDNTRRQLFAEHFGVGYESLAHRLQLIRLPEQDTEEGDVVQDWDVPVDANAWYFRDVQPAQVYVARLITFTSDGAPFIVLRTNTATTPPAEDAVISGHSLRKPLHQRNLPYSAQISSERGVYFMNHNRNHNGEIPTPASAPDYPYMNEFDGYSITQPGGRTDG